LTGVLDPFFDGKLAPLLETNRGCPFTCTFCVQGTRWYTKVHYFAKERIQEEIRYIAKRIHEVCPTMGFLRVADPNYGMYERDAEISGWIGEAQAEYGWPTFIDATTGKNRPDRVIKSLEKTGGALVLYQAVQSLDERTLKNIKRSNISKEAYDQIMIHVRGRGLRSLSDLILGLPGETLESHLEGVCTLIDSGTHELHLFQAMLLKGSELEMQESRDAAQMDNRFRVLPKNFGIYGGEMVFDMDEIIVGTETLPFDDYIVARKHALASTIFQNNSWLEDAVVLTQHLGIERSEWFMALATGLKEADGEVGELVAHFERETRGELFDTPEALIEFHGRPENFEKLEAGEIGDNLMYKYRADASFFAWPAVCAVGMAATRQLIEDRALDTQIDDFGVFWKDLTKFTEVQHAHGTTPETILAPVRFELRYDLPKWVAAGRPADPSPFRLPGPTLFEAALPEESAREIRGLFDVWTTSLMGLTKGVTRIRAEAQLRECRPVTP
ncbi:MAG: radical SAM protein, partial [Deltaproteobacteria bacterium]|nr:radical SAM protein [Deltaproteobacteria bacterium]